MKRQLNDKIILRLYTTPQNPHAKAATETLQKIRKIGVKIDLEIIDITKNPKLARENHIIAIPTLDKIKPKPTRRIIGDLSDDKALLKFLGVSKLGRVPNNPKSS